MSVLLLIAVYHVIVVAYRIDRLLVFSQGRTDMSLNDATERTPLISPPDPELGQDDHTRSDPTDEVESPEQRAATEEDETKSKGNVQLILPVVSIGVFLAVLDQSVVAAINGDIGSDLHAVRSVSWIATAYFLSMTCSQPLYGKLSDVFGRKPSLLFAYTMFGIGSLGCGLTGTLGGLIAARVSYLE